ncbi:MAG: hypothetical protein WC455_16400 [Dehalococcoidia bacterium]|jgi:hypothetical protein
MIRKYNLDSSLVNYIDNLGMGVEARGALGGTVYYVEGNAGNDAWDGLSIDKPFKTLAKAIAVSHADMARRGRWAKRNTIYVFADSTTENLVAFPQKTDIVGLGSCDAYQMASVKGNHEPVNDALGTRFFNVRFIPATAAIIHTLVAGNNGVKFFGCAGVGSQDGITATSFISTTAVELLHVVGCEIDGAFSADVIAIGAGNASGLRIIGNDIVGGANDGIVIDTGATYSGVNSRALIKGNMIQVAGCTIKDVPDSAVCTDNNLISAAATGTASLDINIRLAARNWITDATKGALYPGEH